MELLPEEIEVIYQLVNQHKGKCEHQEYWNMTPEQHKQQVIICRHILMKLNFFKEEIERKLKSSKDFIANVSKKI